jgi:malate synthase
MRCFSRRSTLSFRAARAFGSKQSSEKFDFAKSVKADGINVAAQYDEVSRQFSPEALRLLRASSDKFSQRQDTLVKRRLASDFVPSYVDKGRLEETAGQRRKFDEANTPKDLHERKVELTGPVSDPAMAITALNSRSHGVACYMGDAEDASTCSLANTLGTLKCNYGIARRTLSASKKGSDGTTKEYKLDDDIATYIFRVPNLHLPLPSVLIDDKPASAFLFHVVMYAVNNAKALRESGSGPYLYVPKLEGADEAKYVDDVLTFVESELGLQRGSIKVTVLIEAWPTVVELPRVVEAMMESRRIVGINAARWDYLASLHKHFGHKMVFPPRKDLTMMQPFMVAYVKRIVQVAHHYGIHGIGGMSAFIPAKDAEQNKKAMTSARTDKERECAAGLDGAWIAHPGMANIREAFEAKFKGANQINDTPDNLKVSLKELMPDFKESKLTQGDVDFNVEISLEYLSAFIGGKGAVALHNMMEDAATMEISRYNLWNHVHLGAKLDNGEKVTLEMVKKAADRIAERIKSGKTQVPWAVEHVDDAKRILIDAVESKAPATFLTLPAMEVVQKNEVGAKVALDLRRPVAH